MEDKPLGCSNRSAPCRRATRRAEGTGAQEANLHKAKKPCFGWREGSKSQLKRL